jgi:DNA-binding NtrC family response regulator
MTGGLPEPARLQAREAVEVARRGLSVAGVDRNRARSETRTVVVVSPDARLRQRLASSLAGLRWWVREASGGAQAMMLLEEQGAEAMVVDHWLPDLEVGEFAEQARLLYPEMDLLLLDGEPGGGWSVASGGAGREARAVSPRRNELLYAMRGARDRGFDALRFGDGGGAREPASEFGESGSMTAAGEYPPAADESVTEASPDAPAEDEGTWPVASGPRDAVQMDPLPELVGGSHAMREVAWLVRLVAPRTTAVLIEGETGTGKEVIARVLHRLSPRAGKPFAVLNCAAIPESLLEAELFGHTRGAFTGAVQSRMGRIEAAHGGTLLLDEIGEMPLGMQAKMLRFLESGELQRVGDNELTRVDVRLIAATHQPLEQRSAEGKFRLDLYHRLAVFPIHVPPLRERMEDIPALVEHFLEQMGQEHPRKRLRLDALTKLNEHLWPGNVRELMHVLERAAILAGARPEIGATEIRYRWATRG